MDQGAVGREAEGVLERPLGLVETPLAEQDLADPVVRLESLRRQPDQVLVEQHGHQVETPGGQVLGDLHPLLESAGGLRQAHAILREGFIHPVQSDEGVPLLEMRRDKPRVFRGGFPEKIQCGAGIVKLEPTVSQFHQDRRSPET